MPERRGSPTDATDRPSGFEASLPTVLDIVRLPVLQAGDPEIVAGTGALDRAVRWVHVSDNLDAADLLDGGELLLSTGAGWSDEPAELTAFVERLRRVRVAGLVLELGGRLDAVPSALVEACDEAGLPLIVLRRIVKFVAVTEAVHSRIILEQADALRERDRLHELFIGLSLRGSTAEYIVEQLARVLRAPVVLEDLNHRVVAAEMLDAGDEALADWESTSRTLHRDASVQTPQTAQATQTTRETPTTDAAGWDTVAVEARGIRWGSLIALPGEPHTAGRSQVMEQAAVALAIGRLAEGDADEWTRLGNEQLLADLLGARYSSDAGIAARFEAAGLPVRGRALVGIAVHPGVGNGGAQGPVDVLAAASLLGGPVIAAPRAEGGGQVLALSVPPEARLTDAVFDEFARRLARGGSGLIIGVGAVARDLSGLIASIEEAQELLRSPREERGRGVAVLRAENRPLLRLVAAFAGDPRLQAHSEQMLRPLIEYDLEVDGDLLAVLLAYVSHPGNRTKAAAASHLSRSVFYQRIALIEDLLDVDLDDGETVSALHAALLARR
ncbi:PucR family transcriptional regulator ligand-binding domain-containing protein [Leifsonia sp. YIM 134122]|uniref:PucR family transcriptional regulator ligand-binding domain-containing protein n=1 Tax=Leifsonia stereocauli TaxID=3134136 RepID=A0ABU9W5N8_9MICO